MKVESTGRQHSDFKEEKTIKIPNQNFLLFTNSSNLIH